MNKPEFDHASGAHAQLGAVASTPERPEIGALLDRYKIAVIMNAAYEWGGYRYSNAGDAIAAAKRGER